MWEVQTENEKGHLTHSIIKLAQDTQGARLPSLEKTISVDPLFNNSKEKLDGGRDINLELMQGLLERELLHRRIIVESQSYRSRLVGLVICR